MQDIIAALEAIMDMASDKHVEEMAKAVEAHKAKYPRSWHRMPDMFRALLEVAQDEHGYRTEPR